MKLYGSTNKQSFNTLKLRAALAEAGVAYEFVPVDLDKGENKTPSFLAINPHGKVPTLTDGTFSLPESNAILWYIADAHPASGLVPKNDGTPASLQARARVAQFVDFAQTTLYAAYVEWWIAALGDEPDPETAASAVAKIHRGLGVLETVLAERAWIATTSFSIADLSNASMIFALARKLPDDPLAKYPRVRDWYARVSARPSFSAALAR
ncbi:MAG TPA: glutathione S-transferase family protein [Polyangia bacterium]|jgi:glutathione S-transferase|nr:glutathione S-transferase family protein [Polyangia bacterium]